MFQIILYSSAIILTIISFFTDKHKTKLALIKAAKSFEAILPLTLLIMCSLGIILAFVNNELILKIIGPDSGVFGIFTAAILGSIVQMAGFIAYPLGATLLKNGAGIAQVGTLISSLMIVSVLTLPLEIKYWGKKATLLRNGLGFFLAIIIGLILGVVC